MKRPLAALLALGLVGCPHFPQDGVYQCDPANPQPADCGGAQVDAGATCSNGFCRVYTAPSGVSLRGLSGNATAVAVVGTGGHVAEYVDGGWATATIPDGGDLVGVAYRPGGEAVVAVSTGAILRRATRDTTWSRSVVAGGGRYLMVFESGGDIWIGRAHAAGPLLLGADGGIESINKGYTGDYVDVGGSAPNDVAFLLNDESDAGLAFYSGGGSFGGEQWPARSVDAVFLRGTSREPANEIVIAGAGGFLTAVNDRIQPRVEVTSAHLRDLFGISRDEIWAVGHGGTVLRFDGSSWGQLPFDFPDDLLAGWQRGPNDVWIVSERSVFHWTGP